MRLLLTLCLLALPALAQAPAAQEQSRIDRWRGLVIDESTPDDAIRLLGKPKKDKLNSLRIVCLNKNLFSEKREKKVFRALDYRDVSGSPRLKQLWLEFLENKLVNILMAYKDRPEAGALHSAYGVPFTLRDSAFNPLSTASVLGRLPPSYKLNAVGDRAVVGALVLNSSTKALFVGSSQDDGFPGKVWIFQHISRTLLKPKAPTPPPERPPL
jgi:hypothetical protein